MMHARVYRGLLPVILLFLATALPGAAEEPRISDPSYLDQQFMAQQRTLLDELVASNFGRRFNGDTKNDLELLQLLLDRKLVRAGQTRELQAMGVVMGDLLAADLDLKWVIYEDALGRSRALEDDLSDTYLFPMTMIARRREADNMTPVIEIYEKARGTVLHNRPDLPFR